MSIKRIQRKIKHNKNLCDYTVEELKYVQKPIGKAIYKSKKIGRPCVDVKADPKDKLECEICGKIFIRSGRYNHNKTEYHIAHANMNDKIRKLLINN